MDNSSDKAFCEPSDHITLTITPSSSPTLSPPPLPPSSLHSGQDCSPTSPSPLLPIASPSSPPPSLPYPKEKEDLQFDDLYDLGPEIGSGNFAIVHRCSRRTDGREFAVKILTKLTMSDRDLNNLHQEILILSQLNHPNVVNIIDVFDDGDQVFMVQELCQLYDLFDLFVNEPNQKFDEESVAQVLFDISSGLDYLHRNGVCHRDIKPENLLIGLDNNTIKIGDFGLAHYDHCDNGAKKQSQRGATPTMTTCCGTPLYVAPEIVRSEQYNCKVDFWSLGVCLYLFLSGLQPFSDNASTSIPDIYRRIVNGDYNFASPQWQFVSTEAKDLITKLLCPNPEKRWNHTSLCQHPWIIKYIDRHALCRRGNAFETLGKKNKKQKTT